MKIGITGATGLIGQLVGRLAQEQGHEVVAYTRRPDATTFPWASEVRAINTAAEQPLDASGLDCLIHLAGESILGLWTKDKMSRIRSSRVDLTTKIARSLSSCPNPPSSFICASGVGYYGSRGDTWLNESCAPGEDFLAKVCVDWEAASKLVNSDQTRTVQLRTGLVLSNRGGSFALMKRAFQYGVGGRLGDGTQFMPWIHGADEAGLILWAATNKEIKGPLNLVAPNPVSNADFTARLSAKMKRWAIFHAPRWALTTALGGLGEMILGSQRAKPEVASAGGYSFQFKELGAALDDLLR